MNTLREIVAFTGVTGLAGVHVGEPFRTPSIRSVARIVPLLSGSERTSMLAMIRGLQKLPPISLEAEIEGEISAETPFRPAIRVHPSDGVILETRINFFRGAVELPVGGGKGDLAQGGEEVLPNGNIKGVETQFGDPGVYFAVVTRTGITNVGVTVLEKKLGFSVRAKQSPPVDPPPPVPPFIAVESKGDGSFIVTGSKFLPNATIHILVGDGTLKTPLAFVDTSNPEGRLLGFKTGKICQQPGQIFFVANDGRLNPKDHHQVESNTVTVSCPF
jgi:hypothetical protein